MKTELELINDHFESALYAALGLPNSAHASCLAAQIREAHEKWVAMYQAAEERAKKSRPI